MKSFQWFEFNHYRLSAGLTAWLGAWLLLTSFVYEGRALYLLNWFSSCSYIRTDFIPHEIYLFGNDDLSERRVEDHEPRDVKIQFVLDKSVS